VSDPRRAIDPALQDYLDGRLSADERSAFESRLTREPALRSDLDHALEIRHALGGEPPALSPGFYSRARARFEESAGGSASRWSFRLLSWETAGVAAAAALTTALFVPWLMDEGIPTETNSAAPQAKNQLLQDADHAVKDSRDESQVSGPALMEEAEVRSRIVAKQKADAPQPSVTQERKKEAAQTEWSPEPEGSVGAVAAGAKSNEPSREAGRRQSDGRGSDAQTAAAGERYAPTDAEADALEARPRERLQAPTTPPPPPARKAAPAKRVDRIAFDDSVENEAIASGQAHPLRVALAVALVEPGTIRTIEDPATWQALLDGPHGTELATLGPPTPDRRLILIGARDSLDCDSLRLVRDGGHYIIEAGGAGGSGTEGAGCALALPRDGRPVSVVTTDDAQGAP
jgi:hypothetical protein